jgi:hypothetical protein
MPGQYFGKYTGIVKDNKDPDNLGQIKVIVPAIFPEDEQMTARPALPYGFFFVPEVDAKVWVEFEGGDSGLPIWTGVQYIQGEWAPEAEESPPEKRVVKSAKGHLVIFNDKDGEESIEIKDGKNGHTVKLDQNGVSVKDGKSSHELKFDTATITLKHGSTGAKIEIGPAGITIDGIGPINLSASAAMPVLRANIDQGIGNLGAPVPLIGPGNPLVKA